MYKELIGALFYIIKEHVSDRFEQKRAEKQLSMLENEMEKMDEVIKNYEQIIDDIADSCPDKLRHVSQRSDRPKSDDSSG